MPKPEESERRAARRARLREQWEPPGPRPPGHRGESELAPGPEESLDSLCGHFRIFQRRDGYRFTTDDMLCAWCAARAARERGAAVRDVLDLGTGVGSVALMLAWLFPEAKVTGIEAQPISASLAMRSVRYNGLEARCVILTGDLRERALLPEDASFDIVTATPPYLPVGAGVESTRPQRGEVCFTHRGDVRDYSKVAARLLRPDGVFIVVFAAYRPDDVAQAAAEAGLRIDSRKPVVPREGKKPLLDLFVLSRSSVDAPTVQEPPIVVRDRQGQWTAEYRELRRELGFPDAVVR